MKILRYLPYSIAVLLLVMCKNEKSSIPFELYHKMDIDREEENKLNPRTTVSIPFSYNQIFDPFLSLKENRNSQKADFLKGNSHKLKIHVLDSITTKMNVTQRKGRKERFVKAFPVIIENIASLKTMSLPVHRGCAVLIQQMKTKKNTWIDIEKRTKEKLGDFYYQIKPKQYIFTKIPIYEGNDSVELRVKLELEETEIYSNSYFSTVPNWIKKKQ